MRSGSILLCLLATVHYVQLQAVNECIDVEGVRHKEGESYLGPDKCNTCKCMNGRSACTKKFCSSELKREAAEARYCVDNMGNLHQPGDTYTHVDGCNSCQCKEYGGACTRMFCMPEQQRSGGMCVDQAGNKKNPDETWMSRDGCNHCICSIFGPMCTKKMCSVSPMKSSKIAQNCMLTNGTSVSPGATWLSDDSCNVCTCSEETGQTVCTEESCRYRLHKMKDPKFQYSGAETVYLSTSLVVFFIASRVLLSI